MSGTGHPDPALLDAQVRVPSRSRLSQCLSSASSRCPQTRQAGRGGRGPRGGAAGRAGEELGLWGLGWALITEQAGGAGSPGFGGKGRFEGPQGPSHALLYPGEGL